jgi:hypothetical protein
MACHFLLLWNDGTILTGLGLALTFFGACWTAFGVFITPQQAAHATASLYSGGNPHMKAALLLQSMRAKWGLGAIALGAVSQLGWLVQHAIQMAN